jgi:hypothetical protein
MGFTHNTIIAKGDQNAKRDKSLFLLNRKVVKLTYDEVCL